MGKLSELDMVIKDLRSVAAAITEVANTLAEMFSGSKAEEAEAPVPAKPTISLEQVRAVLAEKSRMGFTAEIRSLLLKYGAPKLSQIDPEHYEAMLAEAEVLTDVT